MLTQSNMLLINVGHMMSEGFEEVIDESGLGQSQDNCIDSPGAFLSARRQLLGWSIEQVADQIKLAPRQVRAIESDDYPALPPMVVTRGFIRSYAKCLKVDATPLLAMIKPARASNIDEIPLRLAVPVNFSAGRFPSIRGGDRILSKWNLGVVFLIMLLLSALLAQKMEWLPDLSKMTITSSINQDQSISAKASTISENEVMVSPVDVGKVNVMLPPVVKQTPILESKNVSTVPVTVTPVASNTVAEKNQLVLQAHEDSWIEIKRADKSIIFSRILKSGEVEGFKLSEPVLLTIGNVAGVDVTLRGEILNAKAGVNGNVAKINLK